MCKGYVRTITKNNLFLHLRCTPAGCHCLPTLTSMWLLEITTRQEQRFLLELAHLSGRQRVSTLTGARSHAVIPIPLQEWIGCRGEGGVCTVRYLTCVFDVCSLSEMAGIEITAGEKLHCREKSSHVGNKTRQTGTKLASSNPNPLAGMDWLSRIRRVVYGALPYLCVGRVFPVRNDRDWNHRGRKAPLSEEKLARREQNSPDGNKTRQQWSQ